MGNRTEFIGLDIYYSQEFVDDLQNNYIKEIKRLNNIINEAKEFIYENAYDEERKICIDDLWGEIPKLLEILDIGSDEISK